MDWLLKYLLTPMLDPIKNGELRILSKLLPIAATAGETPFTEGAEVDMPGVTTLEQGVEV